MNPYEVLGVSENADEETIKNALADFPLPDTQNIILTDTLIIRLRIWRLKR